MSEDRVQVAVIEDRYSVDESDIEGILQWGGFGGDRYRKAHWADNSTTLLDQQPVTAVEVPIEIDQEVTIAGTLSYVISGDALLGTHYTIVPSYESPIAVPLGASALKLLFQLDPNGVSGAQWFREKVLLLTLTGATSVSLGAEKVWKLYVYPVAPPPSVDWNAPSQTVGTGPRTVVIDQGVISQEPTTIYYKLAGALTDGLDYTIDPGSESGVLTIPAGQSSVALGLTVITAPGTITFSLDHELSDRSDTNTWTFTHDWTLDTSSGAGSTTNFSGEPSDHVNGGGGFATDADGVSIAPPGATGTVVESQADLGIAPGARKVTPDGTELQGVTQSQWIAIDANSTKPGSTQWYIRETFENQVKSGGPVKLSPLLAYNRVSVYVEDWPAPFSGVTLDPSSKNSRFVRISLRNRTKDLNHAVMFDRESTGVDWEGNPVPTVTTQTGVWGLWRTSRTNPAWSLWGTHFGVVEETIDGVLRTRLWHSHFADESVVYPPDPIDGGSSASETLGSDGMNPIFRFTYFKSADGSANLSGPAGVRGRGRGLLPYWTLHERNTSILQGAPPRFWEQRRNWWEPRGNATMLLGGTLVHTMTVI